MVQCLGLCAFTARVQVQSLVREQRSCKLHTTMEKKKQRKKDKEDGLMNGYMGSYVLKQV